MAKEKDIEILIIKVSKPFKQKIRQRAKKGHFGTITNYLRSVLREDIEASEKGFGRGTMSDADFRKASESGRSGSGMVLVDANTQKIRCVDDEYARMHGYTKEELLGKPISDLYTPSSRPLLERHIGLLRRAGHHTYLATHQRKDGSQFTVLVEVRPILDPDGVAEQVVAHVRPVCIPSK